uniref:Putative gamma-interferon-inducible lysosomal thiol reductase isoform X1 n=1 Tax=Davidia involucrata TaxID=16924 RepID=A0A5B7ABU3_DAVIN
MESGRRVSSSSLLSHHLLLLLWITFLLSASDSSSASGEASGFASQKEKVTLAFYYETLCPYCSNFIVNYLINLFDSPLISIVDLKLVPYGNAKIGSNHTITCQHGPSECLLNTIEACAISVWPDVNEHFPFIYCIETLVYERKYPQWESCFEKLGLDPTPITDCYSSGYGKELELQYAAETNALQPPHTYVPWVVVDGQPLYEDYENFISYICKAYEGTAIPTACSDLSLNTILKEKAIPIHPVCYAEETTKSTLSRIRSAITWWMRQVNMVASA